jgi:peptidoglycan/xylan/chitin deacetylase (PgdA/CDA1 family)
MYHRIGTSLLEPNWLAVAPENFSRQMEYVQRTCRPMRLLELVEALRQGSLPRRAVVITFDDGYSDNFHVARPMLEKLGLSATVFVTSGHIDSSREFWWDDIERMLIAPRCVPPSLQMSVAGETHEWPTATLDQRQQAYLGLKNLVRPLPVTQREELLDNIATWANVGKDGRPAYRPMASEELVTLASNELFDFGAHTVTHPLLSTLSNDEQFAEILGSRQQLEEIIGKPVRTFCYPTGDYSEEVVGQVKRAGFDAACTVNRGRVEAGHDLFQLHRGYVGDWDLKTFRQNLESIFYG